jgi:hypothetical protein
MVLDNVRPATWPELNVLAIAVEEAGWFGEVKEVELPAIVDWRVEHPLLRHVSFDNVHVRQSKAVATPTWALPVVESSGAPLILAGERRRRRIVWVGFDLWESDWPLRISFPIFVANAVGWLNPAELEGESRSVPAGEPIRLRLEPGVREAEVVRPDGVAERLPLGPSAGEVVYGRTERQGVYQVRVGTQEVRIAVNLLDAAETQVQPRAELDFGRYGAVGASVVRSANLEVWRWFVVVGLGMMALEWWYYHRRTA